MTQKIFFSWKFLILQKLLLVGIRSIILLCAHCRKSFKLLLIIKLWWILYDEFMSWLRRLGYSWFSAMFKKVGNGDLPLKFLMLYKKSILCPFCSKCSMKRRSWYSKGGSCTIWKTRNFQVTCLVWINLSLSNLD